MFTLHCLFLPTALLVTVDDTGTMNAGSFYTVTCTVTDTVADTTPTVVWLDPLGQQLPNSMFAGVVVQGPFTGGVITTAALVYNPLRASHAGDYTCSAHLEAAEMFNITESQIHAVNPSEAINEQQALLHITSFIPEVIVV